MEIGTIGREMHIEASPEVVYRVVSEPEHIQKWWPEEADEPLQHQMGHVPAEPQGARPDGSGQPAPHDVRVSNWH